MKGVVVLALAQFLVIVDETAVSLLAPSVAREFGLGAQARQVLVTPFAVAFVCALPVTGLLLRRVDPRMVVAPALVAFGLTATTGALAPTLGYLVAARAAQGVAAAVTATCILASLHLVTRRDPRRVRAFAVFSLISGSGSIAALVIAGPLAAHSWRWCFWAIAVSAVGCAGAWGAVLPRRLPRLCGEPSARPSVNAVFGRDALTRWTFAAVVGANAVLAMVVITVSFALQQDRGWSATWAGLGFLPSNAAAGFGAFLVARSSRRLSTRRLLAIGTAVLAAGAACAATMPSGPIMLLAITIPVGLGIGIVFPVANHGTLETAGVRPVARAATLGVAQQVGLAAGALVAASRSGMVMVVLSAVLGVGLICAVTTDLGQPSRRFW